MTHKQNKGKIVKTKRGLQEMLRCPAWPWAHMSSLLVHIPPQLLWVRAWELLMGRVEKTSNCPNKNSVQRETKPPELLLLTPPAREQV